MFNFAQTPRATLPNLRNPGVLNVPPSPNALAAVLDYEINLKAEVEIIALHEKLNRIRVGHLEELIGG